MVIKDKFRFVCLCFLFLLFTFLISQKIHFSVADLGRHIKNGEIIINTIARKGLSFGGLSVLRENLYSYTYPDFNFLNHHWGTGVIFYLVNQAFGFTGLSIFFVFFSGLTFFLFFKVAEKNSNFNLAFLISVFLLPLFADRVEIRPEVFSYLFCGLFLWILDSYTKGERRKLIYLLPIFMVFWINLHVYFIFGLFLIGVFALEDLIKGKFKGKFKKLFLVLFLSSAACLVNPAGIKGLLYPLHIFDEYGYSVFENQSLFYIEKIIGFYQPGIYFKIAFVIFVLSFIFALIRKSKLSVSYLLFAVFFGYLSIKAVRNFALFGFFALPIICANLSSIKKQLGKGTTAFNFATINLFVLFIFLLFVLDPQYWINRDFGWGLRRNSLSASDFFIKNKLKGPIFNNYDIGGSLIYSLYPKEKVFVDNRPEAYPASFFKEVYIPMLDQKSVWDIQTQKYNFNSIFFYRLDLTNWGQAFLIRIVQDPLWAPVYVDDYNIIFLKRNEENNELIKKFELPKEMFSVRK